MEAMIGAIIGITIGALVSGTMIWIVGKLNLGLSVVNFGWAMLAGLIIGLLTTLVSMVVPGAGGIMGAVVHLVVSAAVIFVAGKALKGLTVDGPAGALLAACAIAAIGYLVGMLFAVA